MVWTVRLTDESTFLIDQASWKQTINRFATKPLTPVSTWRAFSISTFARVLANTQLKRIDWFQ
jgi:hypothetical protein